MSIKPGLPQSFFSRCLRKLLCPLLTGYGVRSFVLYGNPRYLKRLLLRGCMPGVARRLLTFFASPKKVSKERRPQSHCLPFGQVPKYGACQSGGKTNSLRSNMSSHNSRGHIWQRLNADFKVKSRVKIRFKNNFNSNSLVAYSLFTPPKNPAKSALSL